MLGTGLQTPVQCATSLTAKRFIKTEILKKGAPGGKKATVLNKLNDLIMCGVFVTES